MKMLVAFLSAGALLTGCVSADVLFSSPTMKAKGPAPAPPEPRLDTVHQSPPQLERRDYDRDKTVVSLTFDDGNASQHEAVKILDEIELEGTFYVNSSVLDSPGYFSRAQLDAMANTGHEIAGHGVQHRNLSDLEPVETVRQICMDRKNLSNWGYQVTSFAFPEAGSNPAIEQAVADCGYNSARGLGGIESVTGCEGCGYAESFDPKNIWHTLAPAMVDADWTVEDMQNLVLNAEENGGGWIQITFHHLCPSSCNEISVQTEDFAQFVSWLKDREQKTGTVVRTVDEVVGGPIRPIVDEPELPANTEGNLVVNSGFSEQPRGDDFSRCWQAAGYGKNNGHARVEPKATNDSDGVRLEITNYRDGDFKFLQRLDLGECATQIIPGERYEMKATYSATTTAQFVLYLRDPQGDWLYWTASDWLAPTDAAKEAVWVAPAIPEGFTGLSFGLSLFSEGILHADDVEMSVYSD
ncbi:polysaccharide deacetylase [Arthrobacter sp. MYb224]|uniref:polysaccharide deacetylase family protein n=2 Tax=Micrococcaceae TaxID=1268 RepID=UPI000CFC70ED|nr:MULTISPECIES: polysaccharide deacetylase family protein [unclassified Arthrobacter]PQZ97009.1 polysaccharide deacetylase [Arthrobacter sp. MYb224]PQZ99195.1 polysaccharide deacetylase [Arthrobacter sp. MYb229]PRB47580.1 polysaccharide deacetylase [Arthrobacter sp. MYb216]